MEERKSKGHSRILINEKKFWPAVQVFGESPPTREPARKDFAASDYWIVIVLINTILILLLRTYKLNYHTLKRLLIRESLKAV